MKLSGWRIPDLKITNKEGRSQKFVLGKYKIVIHFG